MRDPSTSKRHGWVLCGLLASIPAATIRSIPLMPDHSRHSS